MKLLCGGELIISYFDFFYAEENKGLVLDWL